MSSRVILNGRATFALPPAKRNPTLAFRENLLTFSLDASQAGDKDKALRGFYARMVDQFRVLPGVRTATVTDMPLVAGWDNAAHVKMPGTPHKKAAMARPHP